MGSQTYDVVDVARLEVDPAPGIMANLLSTYAAGSWTKSPSTAAVTTSASPAGVRFAAPSTNPLAVPVFFRSVTAPVPPAGGMVTGHFLTRAAGDSGAGLVWSAAYEFLDAAGAVLATSAARTRAVYLHEVGGSPVRMLPAITPAGAVSVRLRIDLESETLVPGTGSVIGPPPDNGYVILDGITVTEWLNIVGPSHSVEVVRQELTTGTLTATVLDPDLAPYEADGIKPGQRARLVAGGQAIYTGTIKTAQVDFDRATPARVVFTGHDRNSLMAQTLRSEGVATIGELAYVLAGLPGWALNGDDSPSIDTATVVARNENASALDQVAVTRDSVLGFAWTDQDDTLQVWDREVMPDRHPIEHVPNGTFETDASGWSGANAAILRTTAQRHAGVASLQLTAATSANMSAFTPSGVGGMPVRAGLSYWFSAWFRPGSTTRSVRINVDWYDAAGALALNTSVPNVTEVAGEWIEASGTLAAPAGAAFLRIRASVVSPAAGEVHYVDDISVTSIPVLDESVYSGLDLEYDTEHCINDVTVTFLRIDPATGETEEVPYGPYRDGDSIEQWGQHGETFTIQWENEDPVAIAAYAQSILAANATPVIRPVGLTVPVLDEAEHVDSGLAGVDLYDPVNVVNSGAGIDAVLRVVSIRHTLTARPGAGAQWLVTYGFAAESGVASPIATPSPGTGGDGKTLGQLLRPVGEVTMWYGIAAECPPGWLVMDGSAFDGGAYPDLAALLGGTVLPDMTDVFPIGAGTKALGTSGGSPTQTLTEANLPGHTHSAGALSIGVTAGSGGGGNVVRGQTGGTPITGPLAGDTGSTGSGTPVDILNPWRALYFIVRAK